MFFPEKSLSTCHESGISRSELCPLCDPWWTGSPGDSVDGDIIGAGDIGGLNKIPNQVFIPLFCLEGKKCLGR